MNFIYNVLKNWKLLFCYLLFIFSILFSVLVFIIKPVTPKSYYPYIYSKRNFETVQFPIVQHFDVSNNQLKYIHIFLSDKSIIDNSINQYDYEVSVLDNNGKLYYKKLYHDYSLDTIDIMLDEIPNSNVKNMMFEIKCDQCNDVFMSFKKTNNKKNNYVDSRDDDNILEFNLIYMVPNNSYYWYTLVGIVLSLMLYPLAKEDMKNEK